MVTIRHTEVPQLILYKAKRSRSKGEGHYWLTQYPHYKYSTTIDPQAEPIQAQTLRIPQNHLDQAEIDGLFARFLGAERIIALLSTLTLGCQRLPLSLLLDLLQTQDSYQDKSRWIDFFDTHKASSVEGKKNNRKHIYADYAQQQLCTEAWMYEIWVTDHQSQYSLAHLLLAAWSTLKLQSDFLTNVFDQLNHPHRLLHAFSEYGVSHVVKQQSDAHRRILLLTALQQHPTHTLLFKDVYEIVSLSRAEEVDKLLDPLDEILTCIKIQRVFKPSQAFTTLRQAIHIENDPNKIAINVRKNSNAHRFLQWIDSFPHQSYSLVQASQETGLSISQLYRVHSSLNLKHGFDFLGNETKTIYSFTKRPCLLVSDPSHASQKVSYKSRARTTLYTHPELRQVQITTIQKLDEVYQEKGYWSTEDIAQVLQDVWYMYYPERFTKKGTRLKKAYLAQWKEGKQTLRSAYAQEMSAEEYQAMFNLPQVATNSLAVRLNPNSLHVVTHLVKGWQEARVRYQNMIEQASKYLSIFEQDYDFKNLTREGQRAELIEEATIQWQLFQLSHT